MTNLQKRISSAVVLVPLVIGLIYAGPPYSVGLGVVMTLAMIFEWVLLVFQNKKPNLLGSLIFLFGLFYIVLGSLFLLELLAEVERIGIKILFMLLVIVWTTDTGAYFIGLWLKGPKLAPKISPNKTWSGFFGGLIFAILVGGIAVHLLGGSPYWMRFLPMVAVVSTIGQLGDLLESAAKRYWNVKDSSQLIPGHGGLLDRLDSLLGIAFFIAIWEAFG